MNKEEIKEKLISQILESNKGIKEEQLESANLYELNIDSLSIMRIISYWMKNGYKVNFANFMKEPFVNSWTEIIVNAETKNGSNNKTEKKEEVVSDREPFDLTDVQYAYWIGRNESQYLGGVGTHGYMEVPCSNIDVVRLERAWVAVQKAHSMLRARYTDDGKQCVLEEPYSTKVEVEDIREMSTLQRQSYLLEKREKLSHRLFKIKEGQVAGLQLTQITDQDYILHFDIDLLICDVLSFKIILRDLAVCYKNGTVPDLSWWNFADYLAKHKINIEKKRLEDEKFWLNKIEIMPNGPKFMLKPGIEKIKYPRFKRHSVHFNYRDWEIIKDEAAKNRLTVAMVLLTAYARTVAHWSENKQFTLNLPLFNRDSTEGIDQVVADFTNIVLVEMDFSERRTFAEDAKIIQKTFLENAAHTAASGVWVTRQLQKKRGDDARVPVVFSCNLGEPLLSEEFVEEFGPLDYMISQTPQVWIDFQAFDEDGGLTLLWDCIDEIFRDGMLDEMFEFFKQEIASIISRTEYEENNNLSKGEISRLDELKVVSNYRPSGETLHDKILAQAELTPSKVAIKNADTGVEATYEELKSKTLSIVSGLNACSNQGDLVALFLPRGEQEVIGALGVLCSGKAYIPIHVDQARKRLEDMLNSDRISAIITDKDHETLINDFSKPVYCYEDLINCAPATNLTSVTGDSTAYIIYTSGTTGKPKGVEISHEAAVNTINEVNRICCVTADDSILNVSSYDFDLSVYDFWGLLREGGKLFVLSQKSWRDAGRWLEVVSNEKVTLWNSVPTLFKMLLVEAEEKGVGIKNTRVAMLSGDWIDLDIPKRFAAVSSDASFVMAMGGATEASIWSNYKMVKGDVDKDWISIPYGEALAKQAYRVVDQAGADCPCYVPGELWIGGVGVAKGYLGDETLTNNKFISDEYGRWYRTGDMGCFWHDGTIEFLGRLDRQVKIRGHRIELGEVENAIDKVASISKSYVDIVNVKDAKALVAYATLNGLQNPQISHEKANLAMGVADKEAYADILTDSFSKQIKANQDFYTAFVGKKIREVENSLDLSKVTGSYAPLMDVWKNIKTVSSSINSVYADSSNEKLKNFIKVYIDNMPELLDGKLKARDLVLKEDYVEIQDILSEDKQSQLLSALMLKGISQLESDQDKPVEILILDSTLKEFIDACKANFKAARCTVAVSSEYYKNMLEKAYDDSVNVIRINLEEPQYELQKGYDLILCNQSLHRVSNVNVALQNLQYMLKKGGYLYFVEGTQMTNLANITTIFLRKEYTDCRKDSIRMLLSNNEWKQAVEATNLEVVEEIQDKDTFGGFSFYVLKNTANESLFVKEPSFIVDEIKNLVPEYMVPKYYIFLNRLPISANGKVDRKSLLNISIKDKIEESKEDVSYTATEEKLSEIWQQILKVKPLPTDNYFMLGGDSLLATVLKNEIKKAFENEISLESIFFKPVLKDMAKELEVATPAEVKEENNLVLIRDDSPYEPFELTPMQQSYLIGRSGAFKLGNYSSHCYFEMDCENIDFSGLETSWNQVIKIHDMMRAVVCEDNLHQRVLEEVPYYSIKKMDFSDMDEEEANRALLVVRSELEHQTFNLYQWPAYDIRYAKIGSKGRIFISFDNLFFDGWSMFYIFRQWKTIYDNPDVKIDKADITFKEYVLSLNESLKSENYEEDLRYWKDKIDNIFKAPELPVNKESNTGSFKRFSTHLDPDMWDLLKQKIRNYGLTEPVLLMSLYAEVLARYSRSKKFSINLTRFNRMPFTEKINQVVGDFTTLTILSLDLSVGKSFLERAKSVQKVLWSDISHSTVTGVEVERMLNKNKQSDVVMPVVFTSGIGLTEDRTTGDNSYLGKLGYGLSQTPQVWLDMQVYNDATGLEVSLDAVEEMFPDNMVAEMFETFECLLKELAQSEDLWIREVGSIIKINNLSMIEKMNATDCQMVSRTLTDGIKDTVSVSPEKVAITYCGRSYSYKYVYDRAKTIAATLVKSNVHANVPVALLMEKSPEQIIGAVGILMAEGAYLPLNVEHPYSRNERILELAGVKTILVSDDSKALGYSSRFQVVNINNLQQEASVQLPDISEDTLAYIIYTSGTTGEPKGVAITHGAAMNTILDVNKRIGASDRDSTIALSQMNFDLSVYDVFGMLEVGGRIVIPDANRTIEPSYVCELLKEENVTIWNSVPAYIQMVLEYGNSNSITLTSVRHILLSGDWIPVDIKNQAKRLMTGATVHGLGGATEASIWSNWHTVIDEDCNRASIPYGVPLANQTMYIMNQNFELVPNNVPGDLYIGGKGLALGYWNNKAITASSFLDQAYKGNRLYKTGDIAMYSPEGFIVFLGRKDGQVKIGGYRIEIGEIESAIRRVAQCDNVVVVTDNQIHAFICSDILEDIKNQLKDLLPEYMLPNCMHSLSHIPLSANGKVDRKTLKGLCDSRKENHVKVVPTTDNEIAVATIWKECLKLDEVYVDDNFFQLGGDSLKAVLIVNEIKKKIHVELGISTIFEAPTIRGISTILDNQLDSLQEGEI